VPPGDAELPEFTAAPPYRSGKLRFMDPHERRQPSSADRRARPRGGRRGAEASKPWYMRRRLWLAAASVAYVGWRRLRQFRNGRAGDRHAA
jgi:hypothetical protein